MCFPYDLDVLLHFWLNNKFNFFSNQYAEDSSCLCCVKGHFQVLFGDGEGAKRPELLCWLVSETDHFPALNLFGIHMWNSVWLYSSEIYDLQFLKQTLVKDTQQREPWSLECSLSVRDIPCRSWQAVVEQHVYWQWSRASAHSVHHLRARQGLDIGTDDSTASGLLYFSWITSPHNL